MSFTIATAITRITGGPKNAFLGMSAAQELQRINEVLDRFYEFGSWRGLHDTVTLTTTGGILTLSTAYLRLDGLGIPARNAIIPIRSQQFQFSESGPRVQDFTTYPYGLALDQGDVSGARTYQITGDPTTLDALSFRGFARKRYTYATTTAPTVVPDCYAALFDGVLAYGWKDQGDNDRFDREFSSALQVLNSSLGEFEPDTKQVHVENLFSLRYAAIH